MSRKTLPTFTGPNLTGELQLSFQPRIVRRDLRVVRVEEITPRYRRVVLGGEALEGGFPLLPFTPSDHVKLYFPNPETGQLVAYREVGFDEWEVDTEGAEAIHRDYTPRAWDAQARELSIDFVLHDHGIAGRWAAGAAPGDEIVVMGPRANWLLPLNYAHYVAVGDETALPAIARLIEDAPAQAHVTAVIEVADAAEEQPLSGAAELDLHWVHRDTAPVAEGHLSPLETAVRALALPADLGTLYAWAAGEAGAIKPIRRYLRREVGLPKRQVSVDGYWKKGVTNLDHHVTDVDED